MQKLLICATKDLASKLEEKLRHHYDVKLDILDNHDDKNGDNINVCEIKAKIRRTGSPYTDLHTMRI